MQGSEFSAVEDMEKQAKQSYKHEAHLLDPHNHFVVPVFESLDWGKAGVPRREGEKMRSVLESEAVEMEAAVAVRRVADTIAAVGHMEVAVVAGFVGTLLEEHHSLRVGSRGWVAGYRCEVRRMWSMMEVAHMVAGSQDRPSYLAQAFGWEQIVLVQERECCCHCYHLRSAPRLTWLPCVQLTSS